MRYYTPSVIRWSGVCLLSALTVSCIWPLASLVSALTPALSTLSLSTPSAVSSTLTATTSARIKFNAS
ncbi:hypothetical protein QBC45DRAFT_446480, partial [Copromyces sp. CBS 386.78]